MLRRLFEFFPPMSYGMPFCMPSLRELLLRLARSLVSTRKQRHDCHRDLVQLKREGQPSRLSQQEPVLRATKFRRSEIISTRAAPEPIALNQHQARCVATHSTVPGPRLSSRAASCFSLYGPSCGLHVLVRVFCVLPSWAR